MVKAAKYGRRTDTTMSGHGQKKTSKPITLLRRHRPGFENQQRLCNAATVDGQTCAGVHWYFLCRYAVMLYTTQIIWQVVSHRPRILSLPEVCYRYAFLPGGSPFSLLLSSFRTLRASFSLNQPSGRSPFCQPSSSLRFRLRLRDLVLSWLPSGCTSCRGTSSIGRGTRPASISSSSKSGPSGYSEIKEEWSQHGECRTGSSQ
jgi:hypothetical protein